jgi:hypothetical protein
MCQRGVRGSTEPYLVFAAKAFAVDTLKYLTDYLQDQSCHCLPADEKFALKETVAYVLALFGQNMDLSILQETDAFFHCVQLVLEDEPALVAQLWSIPSQPLQEILQFAMRMFPLAYSHLARFVTVLVQHPDVAAQVFPMLQHLNSLAQDASVLSTIQVERVSDGMVRALENIAVKDTMVDDVLFTIFDDCLGTFSESKGN